MFPCPVHIFRIYNNIKPLITATSLQLSCGYVRTRLC